MAKTVKKTTKKEEVSVTPVVETVGEVQEEVTATEEVKKAPAKKSTTKKASTKTEEKATTKKEAAKKETVKVSVTLQFNDKSYTEEELVNIAKDVWKYDLNQVEADLKNVQLYVKPEEGLCYYVFNGDITGSFVI